MMHYTLREWERRPLGPDDGSIPAIHAEALVSAVQTVSARGRTGERQGRIPPFNLHDSRSDGNVLEYGRHHIRATSYVGQVATPNCSLEILPKIDHLASDAAVRARLVHMLGVALDIDILAGDTAQHGSQSETLLDILIRLFAVGLTEQVRRGLPRTYLRREEDRASLRGKLNVIRQFSRLAATPQRIACAFDELSPDIALNQIMAATVRALRPLARRHETQRLLSELAFAYAEVSAVPIALLPWQTLRFDRSNTRWRNLVELARLFLARLWQTTGSGEAKGTALLFDMNDLFEVYVARRLARVLPANWELGVQGGLRHCVTEVSNGKSRFATKPDLLLRQDGIARIVIDTKWKRLSHPAEDAKRGISQADIYQMMAYAGLYRAPILLLYPWHESCGGQAAEAIATYLISDGTERTISVGAVDIARNDTGRQLSSLLGSLLTSPQ